MYDNVMADLVLYSKKLTQGAGLDPQTTIGPLVSEEQQKRVMGYIEKVLKKVQKYFVVETNHTNKAISSLQLYLQT